VLNALAPVVKTLVGGSADLAESTLTLIHNEPDLEKGSHGGRNMHFGIREHAMGSIGNGMLYHGGVRPYVATFFVFSDYMRPAVRLAALNGQPAIFVWTHDSIGLGEDGPTHQPVEHLMALRAIPNLNVFRPADGNETAAGWKVALTRTTGPTGLVLSRQDLPAVTPAGAPGAERGAYVLADGNDVILIASGSEVMVALAAREALAKENVAARVVSMPSWELFESQDKAYRESVLPRARWQRVSVEAGITLGWREYIGDRGISVGVDRFGASAPGEILMEKLGITPSHVVEAAKRVLASR
jgi:transketolase